MQADGKQIDVRCQVTSGNDQTTLRENEARLEVKQTTPQAKNAVVRGRRVLGNGVWIGDVCGH